MSRLSYPIFLDVTDRQCIIIGGGVVGIRKAQSLIDAGAKNVWMIAPSFLAGVPTVVKQVREDYQPAHLAKADIVFAATNVPDVNDAVVRDARARGILVSRADSDDEFPGDFVTPARFERGPVTVTVSAGSAALSVMIREELSAHWDPDWTALAEAMIQLRPEIKQRWDEPTRRAIFRDLATEEAMDVVTSGGTGALRDWINRRYGAAR